MKRLTVTELRDRFQELTGCFPLANVARSWCNCTVTPLVESHRDRLANQLFSLKELSGNSRAFWVTAIDIAIAVKEAKSSDSDGDRVEVDRYIVDSRLEFVTYLLEEDGTFDTVSVSRPTASTTDEIVVEIQDDGDSEAIVGFTENLRTGSRYAFIVSQKTRECVSTSPGAIAGYRDKHFRAIADYFGARHKNPEVSPTFVEAIAPTYPQSTTGKTMKLKEKTLLRYEICLGLKDMRLQHLRIGAIVEIDGTQYYLGDRDATHGIFEEVDSDNRVLPQYVEARRYTRQTAGRGCQE